MMPKIWPVALASLLTVAVAAPAAAQRQPGQPRDTVTAQRRAELEQQVRQRIAVMVKERLQLTDARAQQLQEAESRFELRRRDLMQRERGLRRDLRQQLAPGVAADQQRVASLLDQIMVVHRERALMLEQEQRDLARFLTPVQRARYLGLQAQLRSRVEGMRQRRGNPGQGQRPPARRPPQRP